MLSDFGQSFLVKCRDSLKKEAADKDKKTPLSSYQDDLFHGVDELDIDKLTSEAIESNFDEKIIGSHIVSLSKEKEINETIAYSAIISKAIITRMKKQTKKLISDNKNRIKYIIVHLILYYIIKNNWLTLNNGVSDKKRHCS